MKERISFKKAKLVLVAAVAFAACPGDDIAMVAASLAQSHGDAPHEAVLDRRKIEMKLPPLRISKLPRR